jgi:hypothetical protein
MRDQLPERVRVIECMRRADYTPFGTVELGSFGAGDVLTNETPADVEVQRRSRRRWRCVGGSRFNRKCRIGRSQ